MGALSPFVGILSDRYGSTRVVAAGGIVYAAGMFTMVASWEGILLTIGNALTGVGMAAAGLVPILSAIGRQTPVAHRSLALGLATAGASFGQFAIVPLVAVLQERTGSWQATMQVLAYASILAVPLAIGLRELTRTTLRFDPSSSQSTSQALHEAFRTASFWLLTVGFFVCGFHVAFLGLHLPPYVADKGVGLGIAGLTLTPAELGGLAIGLVGLFNIFGSIAWGWMGGFAARKDLLTVLYLLRTAAFILFLALPLSGASVLAFAAALGFLWLGTVPLTSGLIGYVFGTRHMSTLWGIVFFSHQLGMFFGGWAPGRLYDIQGNYDFVWWIAVGLGLLAALLHWPIRERPVDRLLSAASR
jgi:MFS family permease